MLLSVSSVAGIAIDVVVVAILLVFGFIGFKKGFFKSILSLFSTIVVLILSVLGAGPLAKLVNKIYNFSKLIAKPLCKSISGMGAFYNYPIPDGMSGADIVKHIPSGTNGFLKKLMAYVLKPLSANEIQGETVAQIVSGAFASIIMMVICGILLFIAIKIILSISSRLFDNITRNRVMGVTNKLAGLGFGALKGGIIILVFVIILTLLTVTPFVNKKITPVIQEDTKVVRPIYNFTDKMMGKYIVEGEIIQKWIDKLWENKYKEDGGETVDVEIPNGSSSRPYIVELNENEGVYSSTLKLNFAISNIVYYYIDASVVSQPQFAIYLETVGADMEVYSSEDLSNSIDATNLSNTEKYIVKVTKTGDAVLLDGLLILK